MMSTFPHSIYHQSIPFHSIRYDSFQFISSSTLSFLYGSHKYDRLSVRLAVGLSIRLSTRQTIFGWMLASMWLNWRISLEYYTIVVVIGVGGYVVFMSIQPYENYYLSLVFIRLFLDWLTGWMAIDYRFLHIEDKCVYIFYCIFIFIYNKMQIEINRFLFP